MDGHERDTTRHRAKRRGAPSASRGALSTATTSGWALLAATAASATAGPRATEPVGENQGEPTVTKWVTGNAAASAATAAPRRALADYSGNNLNVDQTTLIIILVVSSTIVVAVVASFIYYCCLRQRKGSAKAAKVARKGVKFAGDVRVTVAGDAVGGKGKPAGIIKKGSRGEDAGTAEGAEAEEGGEGGRRSSGSADGLTWSARSAGGLTPMAEGEQEAEEWRAGGGEGAVEEWSMEETILVTGLMADFASAPRKGGEGRQGKNGAESPAEGEREEEGESEEGEEESEEERERRLEQLRWQKEAQTMSESEHDSWHRGVHEGSGREVVVRRIKDAPSEASSVIEDEVLLLSSLHHPHLLPLLAYCNHPPLRALAFPLLPNASLDLWLHAHHSHHMQHLQQGQQQQQNPEEGHPLLSFTQRLRIAADVADALRFLHSQSPPVAHRDVSSSTVLLDGAMRGHLGGLSLLKHVPGARMQRCLSKRKGYIDPEYFKSFKLVKESDVYSFGVVLLELLSALPPVVDGEVDESTGRVHKILLAQYATPHLESGDLGALVDPLLSAPRDRHAALAVIAHLCISSSRFARPTAAELAEWLSDLATTPLEAPLPDAVVRLIPAAFADLCQQEVAL